MADTPKREVTFVGWTQILLSLTAGAILGCSFQLNNIHRDLQRLVAVQMVAEQNKELAR